LCATSKIGDVSEHCSLLRGFGAALAQACRARAKHGQRRWSGERGNRGVEPSCLRLRRTTQHMRKSQEAISGTLAALRSIASSLIEFAEVFRAIGIKPRASSGQAVRRMDPSKQLPVVRCRGCNRPMDPQERTSVTDRLEHIRYVCAACGMETKRTVRKANRRPQGLGTGECSAPRPSSPAIGVLLVLAPPGLAYRWRGKSTAARPSH
jgi:hypothetical protein